MDTELNIRPENNKTPGEKQGKSYDIDTGNAILAMILKYQQQK